MGVYPQSVRQREEGAGGQVILKDLGQRLQICPKRHLPVLWSQPVQAKPRFRSASIVNLGKASIQHRSKQGASIEYNDATGFKI